MSALNWISENLILPATDMMMGYPYNKQYKFLDKSQWWFRNEIEEYQNNKLRQLIQHAYNSVPYYKALFNNIGLKPSQVQTIDDLKKVPILTKEIIRKNFPDKIISQTISKNQIVYQGSSGSTGEPLQYYTTKSSEALKITTGIRAWYWMGYRLGDKYVKLSMNPRSSMYKKIQDKINNCYYLHSLQINKQNFENILKEIVRIKPQYIRCYPVPLYLLAEIIKEKNINIDFVKAINTTGSTLHSNTRNFIENEFNSRIYDSYSCEGGSNVSQCPEGTYHSSEEYAISEFVEDDFTKSGINNAYRLITTDLHNYAIPFIRYDTQDYVILNEGARCECGRKMLEINKILGRDSDILITPSGKYLIIENFVAYFEWIKEVDNFQVIQNQTDEMIMYLVVNKFYNKKVENEIYKYWKNYIGTDVNLAIYVVDDIKHSSSGKRHTIIRNSEIDLKF